MTFFRQVKGGEEGKLLKLKLGK